MNTSVFPSAPAVAALAAVGEDEPAEAFVVLTVEVVIVYSPLPPSSLVRCALIAADAVARWAGRPVVRRSSNPIPVAGYYSRSFATMAIPLNSHLAGPKLLRDNLRDQAIAPTRPNLAGGSFEARDRACEQQHGLGRRAR